MTIEEARNLKVDDMVSDGDSLFGTIVMNVFGHVLIQWRGSGSQPPVYYPFDVFAYMMTTGKFKLVE